MLLGTIRDRHSGQRRAFVRFYACEEDLSNESPDEPLPERVVAGEEPFIILGAMAGGYEHAAPHPTIARRGRPRGTRHPDVRPIRGRRNRGGSGQWIRRGLAG